MRFRLSIIVIAAATQLGATDCGEVIRDSGFDLWCGTELCTWKVVRGDVQRVDTWHEGDSGVELLGPDAAIAQLSPVDYRDGACIQFDLLADVEQSASARLNLDIYGDGSIEGSEIIPTSRWAPVSYTIRITGPYTGVRFEIAKAGTGRAAFAQIGARIVAKCEGAKTIEAAAGPLGALCIDDATCESGMCRLVPDSFFGAKRCVACDATTCGAGDVCGIAEPLGPTLGVPMTCVLAGADELGEQCATNAECASGICNGLACSTCNDANPCTAGEACAPAWEHGPYVCAPGLGLRASGQACATGGDCASGRCNGGERKACEDNRPCFNDTNCPVDAGLVPGACTTVGIQGGSCE
jgi:hypothetical protein